MISIKAVLLCLALGVGEQLGHSFSQSLPFCRDNIGRVQYLISHPSTLNNTSRDSHDSPFSISIKNRSTNKMLKKSHTVLRTQGK